MRRFLFGFFLMMGVSTLTLCAAEPSSGKAAAVPAVPPASAPTQPVSGIDTAIQKAQEEVRDPFAITAETKAAVKAAPVDAAAPAAPVITVVLDGIGFGSKDAYALIGGDVYYVGDEKNGIKLIEVRRREVDVLVNGGLMTVTMLPKEELQKVKDRADKKVALRDSLAGVSREATPSLLETQGTQSPEMPVPLPKAEGDELPS